MSEIKKFVNEYSYTEQIIREATAAKWYSKTKRGYIGGIVFAIIMLIFFFIRGGIFFLVFAGMFALLVAAYELMKNKAVKRKLAGTASLYSKKKVSIWVKIDSEIKMISPENKGEFPFTSIDKILNTKNLIVLLTKSGKTLIITKDGFTEGNAEDCLEYLKEKTKKAR